MTIEFKGMLTLKSKGCAKCGTKQKSEYGFVDSRRFILPSGIQRTFHVGRKEEVTERDGEFLLSYNYEDANGLTRPVFVRVD